MFDLQEILFSVFAVIPILIIALSIIAWCIESDNEGVGTLLFIGSFIYLGFATDWTILSIIISNAIPVLIAFLVYLAIGISWAFFKWYLVVEEFVTTLKVHIYDFKQKNNISGDLEDTPENVFALASYLRDKINDFYSSHISTEKGTLSDISEEAAPKASNSKAKITAWIAYFPLSMIWTLLHDAVRKLFNRIYNAISGSFQNLSNRATKAAIK